jgi:tRNA-specific 2-thiouridylase
VRKCFLDGRWYLKKAADLSRDQSYVLYPVTQETLSGLLFPLGDLKKTEDVRRIAEEQGFVNARKHDSQDICFVPDGDYASFIGRMVSMEADRFCPGKEQPACLSPGSIIDRSGRVLGRHRGAVHYTIGQRRGLGLAVPESVYVLSKDMQANTVTVGPNEALFSRELTVKDLFWQRPAPEEGEVFRARVRIRYQHREQEASVTVLPGALVRVLFDEGQRAVCPGQAAVFYDGDLVLGGGTIL